MRLKISFATLLLIFSFSCRNNATALQKAYEFYDLRQQRQYNSLKTLISQQFNEATNIDTFIRNLEDIDNKVGRIISYKIVDIKKKTVDSVDYYICNSIVECQNYRLNEIVVISNNHKDFKIDYFEIQNSQKID